jgi:hypothetical protein
MEINQSIVYHCMWEAFRSMLCNLDSFEAVNERPPQQAFSIFLYAS